MIRTTTTAFAVLAILAGSMPTAQAGLFSSRGVTEQRAAALTRQCDANAPWQGWFSGNKWDNLIDEYGAYSSRACFASEADCRAWILLQMDALNGGPFLAADCRRR